MEFGSDFHSCQYPVSYSSPSIFSGKNIYASGRQALQHLIETQAWKRGWKRLWVPAYYCGESLEYIKGIDVKRYSLLPDVVPSWEYLSEICDFQEGDVLMLVNFFGMHQPIDVSEWDITVIEDHTHDIASEWALKSTADWCFASIRKLMPIPDGGILWSPKRNKMPSPFGIDLDGEYCEISDKRLKAMSLKSEYLRGKDVDKQEFLSLFVETEEVFSKIKIGGACMSTFLTCREIDYLSWRDLKLKNLNHIKPLLKPRKCEVVDNAIFSLLLKFKDKCERDSVRRELIERGVYGAILWPDVYEIEPGSPEKRWGDRMLSLHVDGRYTLQDMECLAEILNEVI